jgi:hypothetical protein
VRFLESWSLPSQTYRINQANAVVDIPRSGYPSSATSPDLFDPVPGLPRNQPILILLFRPHLAFRSPSFSWFPGLRHSVGGFFQKVGHVTETVPFDGLWRERWRAMEMKVVLHGLNDFDENVRINHEYYLKIFSCERIRIRVKILLIKTWHKLIKWCKWHRRVDPHQFYVSGEPVSIEIDRWNLSTACEWYKIIDLHRFPRS